MSSNGYILKFSNFSLEIFKHINILCNDINCWDNNTILIIKKELNLPLRWYFWRFFVFYKIYNKYVYTCVWMYIWTRYLQSPDKGLELQAYVNRVRQMQATKLWSLREQKSLFLSLHSQEIYWENMLLFLGHTRYFNSLENDDVNATWWTLIPELCHRKPCLGCTLKY